MVRHLRRPQSASLSRSESLLQEQSGLFDPLYWGTYAAVWLLPAVGLYLAVRRKHRELIWASVIMALATLVTNKTYLGWARHTWDPIYLGVLLTGTALAIRHWLSRG